MAAFSDAEVEVTVEKGESTSVMGAGGDEELRIHSIDQLLIDPVCAADSTAHDGRRGRVLAARFGEGEVDPAIRCVLWVFPDAEESRLIAAFESHARGALDGADGFAFAKHP